MPSIRTNHEIRGYRGFAARSFCAHTCHTAVVENKIDNFVFHEQLEIRKSSCVTGKKIEKIPLRHKRDEFAAGGKFAEIRDGDGLTVDDAT